MILSAEHYGEQSAETRRAIYRHMLRNGAEMYSGIKGGRIKNIADLNDLRGVHDGRPAICTGSGPSLMWAVQDGSLMELLKATNGVLFAGLSHHAYLAYNDIPVDYITISDPRYDNSQYVGPDITYSEPVIGHMTIYPWTLELMGYPDAYMCMQYNRAPGWQAGDKDLTMQQFLNKYKVAGNEPIENYLGHPYLGYMHSGQDILFGPGSDLDVKITSRIMSFPCNPLFSMGVAKELGCDPIYFVGYDLGTPDKSVTRCETWMNARAKPHANPSRSPWTIAENPPIDSFRFDEDSGVWITDAMVVYKVGTAIAAYYTDGDGSQSYRMHEVVCRDRPGYLNGVIQQVRIEDLISGDYVPNGDTRRAEGMKFMKDMGFEVKVIDAQE